MDPLCVDQITIGQNFKLHFKINSLHQMNGVDCFNLSITASNLGSLVE